MDAGAWVVSLLGVVAQHAPSVLAAITGAYDDAQAIQRARDAVARIPARPAGSALDAHERGEP
jgi:hypothetical protein